MDVANRDCSSLCSGRYHAHVPPPPATGREAPPRPYPNRARAAAYRALAESCLRCRGEKRHRGWRWCAVVESLSDETVPLVAVTAVLLAVLLVLVLMGPGSGTFVVLWIFGLAGVTMGLNHAYFSNRPVAEAFGWVLFVLYIAVAWPIIV